jgi:long-chain acyl-CoA synthetase
LPQQLSLGTEAGNEAAIHVLRRQIDRFRKGGDLSALFPDRWLPVTFAVVPEPWTEQNGMVNSTMKVMRNKVEKACANQIAYLYTSEGKNPVNPQNLEAMNF